MRRAIIEGYPAYAICENGEVIRVQAKGTSTRVGRVLNIRNGRVHLFNGKTGQATQLKVSNLVKKYFPKPRLSIAEKVKKWSVNQGDATGTRGGEATRITLPDGREVPGFFHAFDKSLFQSNGGVNYIRMDFFYSKKGQKNKHRWQGWVKLNEVGDFRKNFKHSIHE